MASFQNFPPQAALPAGTRPSWDPLPSGPGPRGPSLSSLLPGDNGQGSVTSAPSTWPLEHQAKSKFSLSPQASPPRPEPPPPPDHHPGGGARRGSRESLKGGSSGSTRCPQHPQGLMDPHQHPPTHCQNSRLRWGIPRKSRALGTCEATVTNAHHRPKRQVP